MKKDNLFWLFIVILGLAIINDWNIWNRISVIAAASAVLIRAIHRIREATE